MIADMIDAFVRKHKYAKLEIKDVARKVIAHFVCLLFLFSEERDLATQANASQPIT